MRPASITSATLNTLLPLPLLPPAQRRNHGCCGQCGTTTVARVLLLIAAAAASVSRTWPISAVGGKAHRTLPASSASNSPRTNSKSATVQR